MRTDGRGYRLSIEPSFAINKENSWCNLRIATAVPWSGGAWFDDLEQLQKEPTSSYYNTTQGAARTLTGTTSKRHMMPLGLAPGFQT